MKNQLTLPPFLSHALDYLSPQAEVHETDENGHAKIKVSFQGLNENRFYLFNGEAALAFSLAIEDLALEEGNGVLLAGFRDFTDAKAYRERYAQIGATIDGVEVVGGGRVLARLRRVESLKEHLPVCKDFRLIAYEGRRHQMCFVARHINQAEELEHKQFFGFYTQNPRLVLRLRSEFVALASGKGDSLREFARQAAIDQAAKHLEREFTRQKQSVEAAMRRLQLDGEEYCAGHFANDLERGLSQLYQWKVRIPEILARATGN